VLDDLVDMVSANLLANASDDPEFIAFIPIELRAKRAFTAILRDVRGRSVTERVHFGVGYQLVVREDALGVKRAS
jgi:hypothetical protein